ncbi:hypothetical protein [Myroides odoratimimus]|uniref:hypothetical protein n=1 Tax=Myroides odoratimimus TaxID=76832 RepID=UPI002575539B|nr:hypothetical protein [Myroides odoratimimus]
MISEEEDGHMSEGVMSINKNIGSRIYGDFNGDGKKEYTYRKLVKERSCFLLDIFRIEDSYSLHIASFDLKEHCR